MKVLKLKGKFVANTMVCRIVDNTFRILKQILSQYYTLYRNSMQLFIIVLSSQKYCTTTWIHNLHAHNISSLRIIISLQQSNETYKHIKSCQHYIRKKSLPIRNIIFTYRYIRILLTVCFLAWLIRLLLLSGDIQPNPGPTSASSANDTNDTSFSSSDSQKIFANHPSIYTSTFKVCYLK